MIMYRLYTENKNHKKTIKTVNKHFKGFTIYKGIGYWNNKKESSACFEIIAKDNKKIRDSLKTIANTIKKENKQEAIYLTESIIKGKLL